MIVSHNKLVLANTTLSECYHVCNSSTQVTCRSFEYNAENQVCQISDVNKWTESQYFLQEVPGWDYYHRKCYFGKYCENLFHIFCCLNYQFSSCNNMHILKGIDDFLMPTTMKAQSTTIVTTGMI